MAAKSKTVLKITKALNKKGKLKGRNKKETRMLKGACNHHKINKHGKIKPTIFSNDGEYCICTMCGAKFPASFFKNEDIKDIIESVKELNNHNKFLAQATNAGESMQDFFGTTGVIMEEYYKNSKKIKNVAEKQSNVKKKKKGGNKSGSSAYGSWGNR